MADQKQHHLGTVLDYDESSALREALEKCSSCSELDWKTFNLDTSNSTEESLENELMRLQALRSYRILDTGRKASFERLTALAARIFDVPICLVSLVDLGRQWFASNRGLGDVRETPRKVAFCAHAILSEMDVFIVPDTLKDPRFRTNGLVTGDPNIRFYAGSPLITKDGYKLGTFCIIDVKPRLNGLSLAEKQNLREIAALAMDQIEDTKVDMEKAEMHQAKLIACTAHDLITPLTSIQLNMGLLSEDENLLSHMNKNQREIIRNTKECVDIMSNICQHSIQTFRGKSTNGLLDLEHHSEGSVNIDKVLKSLDHVMSTYPKKVPIQMRVDEDVPPIIQSEVLSIFRSSLNFLTNACKVTETGIIDFHVLMRKPSRAGDHNSLVFECTDTGPGIQSDKCGQLFTAEGGLKLSEKNDTGGLGLGLHSVSELITEIGGDYGYSDRSSSDGESGSIFWFSVPIRGPVSLPIESVQMVDENLSDGIRDLEVEGTKKPDVSTAMVISSPLCNIDMDHLTSAEAARARARANNTMIDMRMSECASIEKPPMKRKSTYAEDSYSTAAKMPQDLSSEEESQPLKKRSKCALVIDDSKTIRKVIDRALKNFGFDVVLAENGLQGLEEMKTTVFDIVLCDFLMPIMDGMDCVQQYRQWESSHRAWFKQYIVGISAHADDDDGNRGLKVGMNKFLKKPLPIKMLRQLVDSQEMSDISKKLDSLSDDSNALPFFLYVNPKSNIEAAGSTTSSISDDFVSPEPTCLVVEDSISVSKAMVRCIQRHNWQTCLAMDGEEALRLLKTRNWDAVFMDDQLPLLTGSACVLKFREWERKNRVARQMNLYMCSANCDYSSTPPGFDGVLSKPFKPATVTVILDKHSGSRKVNLL